MMRYKGKETMEESSSLAKMTPKGKNPKDATMDLDGIQRATMGRKRWFGWLVCCSLDNSKGKPIGRIFAHLGVYKGWMNSSSHLWLKDYH
jgi:hypothetical protein